MTVHVSDGFPKKVWMLDGWVGGLYPVVVRGFFGIVLIAKPPKDWWCYENCQTSLLQPGVP